MRTGSDNGIVTDVDRLRIVFVLRPSMEPVAPWRTRRRQRLTPLEPWRTRRRLRQILAIFLLTQPLASIAQYTYSE